jgi:hypothetical protein
VSSSSPTPPSSLDPRAETVTRLTNDGAHTTDLRRGADRPLPTIPGYTVVRWLGGGGMGDVYEVVDQTNNVTFALKMVRADRPTPGFAARFRQEVRAMMDLHHPNIARIYHDDEVNGRPYFIMRFVRGGTLANRLPELRADPRAAVRLLVKVIDAVEYLHRQGQVHRDLKPTNILLDESGEPILSDFGLVKELTDLTGPGDGGPVADAATSLDGETQTGPTLVDSPNTRTGARLGTYAYMSPEQATGDVRRVGPASDVWALGVILYELLTGVRPDREAVPSATGVDPELDRIVLKCLATDPADRYPSAAGLAAELRAWLEPAPPPARRRRWLPVAVAAGVVLIATGITLAILQPWKKDPAAEWRAWARKELAANRPVTLVDGEGKPAPGFRFVAGAGPEKAETQAGGWWAVSTTASALAELLDDPGIDDFTLSGQFRPNPAGPELRAGLYVASRRVPADGRADWHYQIEYFYRENLLNLTVPQAQGPAPPPVMVGPKTKKIGPQKKELVANRPGEPEPTGEAEVRYHGSPFGAAGDFPQTVRSWLIDRDRPVPGGPWRTLAIRARDESYAVSWDAKDEEPIRDLRDDERDKLQDRGGIPWQGPPLRFSPRGGLGVIVAGGSAAVRNVTITPHPSP